MLEVIEKLLKEALKSAEAQDNWRDAYDTVTEAVEQVLKMIDEKKQGLL